MNAVVGGRRSACAEPIVRRARRDEAAVLRVLSRDAFATLAVRDYEREVVAAALDYICFDAQLFDSATVLVAEWDGELAGTASWTWHAPRDEVDGGLPRGTDLAYVRSVFTAPRWSGRGVGRALMLGVERDAREQGAVSLLLGATLTGARLYRKLGYRTLGTFEVSLPGAPVTGVHMRLDF